jgi:hypothetical protein
MLTSASPQGLEAAIYGARGHVRVTKIGEMAMIFPNQAVGPACRPDRSCKQFLVKRDGGPGRTRTCNQTVMSGESSPEKPENIDE